MGLDMYLRAKKYVSGYEWEGNANSATYNTLRDLFGVGEFIDPHTPSAEVSFTVAYWRKANAIHNWFVQNVQDGKDECQSSYVERQKIVSLRDLCQRVIDSVQTGEGQLHVSTSWSAATGKQERYQAGQVILNPEVADSLLPSRGGFFFGSTNYDEFYLDDLKNTVAQLDRALKLPNEWSFEYHASW